MCPQKFSFMPTQPIKSMMCAIYGPIWKKNVLSVVTVKSDSKVELVSKELNHLAAILHVYAGGLNFMK